MSKILKLLSLEFKSNLRGGGGLASTSKLPHQAFLCKKGRL
ncbi:hypothetical protein [Campylobacter troglodytis]|nr:hypothetical protein [Campylobacter troglodytis]